MVLQPRTVYIQYRDKCGIFLQATKNPIAWPHKTPKSMRGFIRPPNSEAKKQMGAWNSCRAPLAGTLLHNVHAKSQTWSWVVIPLERSLQRTNSTLAGVTVPARKPARRSSRCKHANTALPPPHACAIIHGKNQNTRIGDALRPKRTKMARQEEAAALSATPP